MSQAIAAWPPLALLFTVELISRVPVYRRSLTAVRIAATTAISIIAAWVSYWHMAGVATQYGEVGASPYLLPFSVDGLIVIASVSLVELAAQIRLLTDTLPNTSPQLSQPEGPGPNLAEQAAETSGPSIEEATIPAEDEPATGPHGLNAAAAVAWWYAHDSAMHPADIGTRVGRSERQVRRILQRLASNEPTTGFPTAIDERSAHRTVGDVDNANTANGRPDPERQSTNTPG